MADCTLAIMLERSFLLGGEADIRQQRERRARGLCELAAVWSYRRTRRSFAPSGRYKRVVECCVVPWCRYGGLSACECHSSASKVTSASTLSRAQLLDKLNIYQVRLSLSPYHEFSFLMVVPDW